MKIAIISDVHYRHWAAHVGWPMHLEAMRAAIAREKPDVIIDAGDAECDLKGMLGCDVPLVGINGNHDWYGKDFYAAETWPPRDTIMHFAPGLTVVGATLWTDYNDEDPLTMQIVNQCLNDSACIRNFTPEAVLREHDAHVDWLISLASHDVKPDVVFTHHAPSMRSAHPRYRKPGTKEDLINYGFVSNLEELVAQLAPKLWVHGHVHDPCDYMLGETRVVAWPMGYPHERIGKPPYEPMFIDI